jgi:hypothetical protein
VSLLGSDPDLMVLHNQCERSLEPGERCDVRVQLSSTRPGPISAVLSAESSGQNIQAPVLGFGIESGPLTLSAAPGFSGDLGSVILGEAVEGQLLLSNPTSMPSGILAFASNQAEFQILPPVDGDCQTGSTVLMDAQTCRIRLAFSPTRRGAVDATLVVTSTALGSTSMELGGSGRLPSELVAPETVDFGGVAQGSTGLRTLQVHNAGDEPLQLSGVALAGVTSSSAVPKTSAFSVQNSDCGVGDLLVGGARCSVTVAFHPLTVAGEQRALLISAANGVQHAVALVGTGLSRGTLLVDAATGGSSDFGALLLGQSATQTFAVTNPSAQPSGPLDLRSYAAFALSPPTADGDCESGVTSLADGESCSVTIRFTPSERGQIDGALTVDSPLAGAAHVALLGHGLGAAELSLADTELDFGRVPTESHAQQSVNVLNAGDQPFSAVHASLEGPNGDAVTGFSILSSCIGEVGASAPCNVAVEFSPTVAAAYSAVLRLASDTGETTSALLLGRAFLPGSLLLTAADGSSDFGDVALNTPRTIEFTLTNQGESPSGRLTFTSSDPVFLVDEGDCNPEAGNGLASGALCTFQVTFAPVTSDSVTATLSVQSPGVGEAALPLLGRGRRPPLLNATGTRDLGVANIGQASLTESNQFTWTVTNEGDLESGVLQITNDNPNEFVVSNDFCSNLPVAASGSCAMDILFRPSGAGTRTGTLVVTDASTLQVVRLIVTGTGVVIAQPGESCLNGALCESGVCTAGVCCDRACEGSCQVCGSNGVCVDQAERQACGSGGAQCFGVNQCLLPELAACSGDEQCGAQNCEPRLGGQTPNDRICCLDDCGITGQQCNPQTGRCQVPALGQGAPCGAAGQSTCEVGLECKSCPGGGNQCTPVDLCCGQCAPGYECIDGDRCGCPIGSNGIPLRDCGGGRCILDSERACCSGAAECPVAFPVCDAPSGLCVQCLVDTDCGTCSTCNDNNNCQPLAMGLQGGCVGSERCDGNGACVAPAPGQLGTTPPSGSIASFGSVDVGEDSAPRTWSIRNVGGSNTGALSLALSGDTADFRIDTDACAAISPGGLPCNINVFFAPTTAGTREATLSATEGPGGLSATLLLNGQGLQQVLVGPSEALANTQSYSANFMIAHSVTIPSAGELTGFGIITREGGTSVNMGLYANVGASPSDRPSTRIAQTGATSLQAGRQEIAVAPVEVPAGDYWIVTVFDAATGVAASADSQSDGPTVAIRYLAEGLTFADSLPADMEDAGTLQNEALPITNFYLVLLQR